MTCPVCCETCESVKETENYTSYYHDDMVVICQVVKGYEEYEVDDEKVTHLGRRRYALERDDHKRRRVYNA
jgi:hypothetical protein